MSAERPHRIPIPEIDPHAGTHGTIRRWGPPYLQIVRLISMAPNQVRYQFRDRNESITDYHLLDVEYLYSTNYYLYQLVLGSRQLGM